MNHLNRSKKDLTAEMQEIKQKYLLLKRLYNKVSTYQKHSVKAEATDPRIETHEIKEKEMGKEKSAPEILKKQNEELRRLNYTKDKFFSIIAHDLKSPFNSIIGFSRILMDKVGKKDLEGTERYSEIINHLANSAMELLSNLMEWSMASTGKIPFKPAMVNLEEILNQVVPLFADGALQKNISIQIEVPSDAVLFADPEMTGVILRNLISNAVKFTLPGGKITISTKQEAENLIISVADTGIGIPDDKIDDLFRIDKSYTRPGTQKEIGTGLGLILCKEFVEKQGGRIWVNSSAQAGSTFSFSLPVTNNRVRTKCQ